MFERLSNQGSATAKAESSLAVPRFTTIHFRFQSHGHFESHASFQAAQEALYLELTKVFRKDEFNIIHMEELQKQNTKWNSSRRKGFQLYGSFKKAHIYAIFRERYPASQITHDKVDEAARGFFDPEHRSKNGVEDWDNGDLIPVVADRLIDDGYKVNPLIEPNVPNGFKLSEEEEINSFIGDLMQFGYAFFDFINRHSFRDKQVAKQLISVVEKAEKARRKTNIYVLRGTYHSSLTQLMPYKYRGSMYASTEFGAESDLFQQLLRKGMIDRITNPEEIRRAFCSMLDEEEDQL